MGDALGTVLSIHAWQQAVEATLEPPNEYTDQEMPDINSYDKRTEYLIKLNLNPVEKNLSVNVEEDKMAVNEVPEETQDHKVEDSGSMKDESTKETPEFVLTREEQPFMVEPEEVDPETEPEAEGQVPNNQIATECVELEHNGQKIFCTRQYATWITREYAYQQSNLLHRLQKKLKEEEREDARYLARTQTPSQLDQKKSRGRIDVKRKECERVRIRAALRMEYGLDYIEVKVTEAEENLKEQPILGRVRCQDPSPLRTCLTLLSDEELETWEEGMESKKTESSSMAMKGNVKLLEHPPEDGNSGTSGLVSEPSQLLRRSRAWSSLFKLSGISEVRPK
jgi:hypothetical protein